MTFLMKWLKRLKIKTKISPLGLFYWINGMKKVFTIIVLSCLAMAFSIWVNVDKSSTLDDENLTFREKISAQFK